MTALQRNLLIALTGLSFVAAGCGSRTAPGETAQPGPTAESGARPAETPSGVPGGADAAVPGSAAAEPAVPAPASAAPPSGGGGAVEAPPLPAAAGSGAKPETAAESPRRVGEIVYAEGSVHLHRGGAAPAAADIGQVVENFDVLQTGPKSRATLELDPGRPGGAEIRLAENTAFYYESALSDSRTRKTVLQLLSGSVALKVEKLADGDFKVGTDSAVLGVRGTTFIVNTVPDGALLVTCAEGRVEVSDDSGERVFAQPGRAVSQRAGEAVREEPVSLERLADYRVTWVDESLRSLEARAPKVIAGYAARYSQALPAFDAAYAKLRDQAPVLDAWAVALETGGHPRFTDWIPEKKAIAPLLFDCLSALFRLERPFYRLQELETFYDRGLGAGTLQDGRTTDAFFEAYGAQSLQVAQRLSYVRRALLLFKFASAGSPLGQFFGSKAESLGSGALFMD